MVYESISEKEAEKRLEKYGPNEIKDLGKTSWEKVLFRQIKSNFIVYILLFAMIVSFFVGKDITAYTILGVIVAVVLTGFLQEFKAERAIEALKKMVMPVSIVVREGIEREIPSREIVPGDLIVLRNGEKIPADCIVVEEKDLIVNESVLTGESKEIRKSVKTSEKNKDSNMIFAGSFIVSGKCIGKVVNTGMTTRFGKIAGMISSTEKELPLQDKVNHIAKYMAIVAIAVAVLTGVITLFSIGFSKSNLIDILILAIAISVSAFPEGLPVVLITTLSSGAYRMAKENAIVNRMSIIETLGETTVICSDKTGTMTKGEMTVKKVFSDNQIFDVTGAGYNADGEFLLENRKISPKDDPTLNLILKASVLCNDAKIRRTGDGKDFKTTGMPTESALLAMASKGSIYKEDFKIEREEELTFTSERKMMSVLLKEKDGFIVYSKGAFEMILGKCSFIQRNNGVFRLLEKDRKKIEREFSMMARNSLRVIAFAYKKTNVSNKEELEKDLIFLGGAGMEDPPREELKEALNACRRAGVSVKMITGDNQETAVSIAKEIGLDKGKMMVGDEIDKMSEKELAEIVKNIVIFSRVRPEHKLRIVKALKENGEIVTMTGDGVNDSPALKEAHIGVAMGRTGTDVSRSVADLVLKDDNFATIVDAIKEGRIVFNNLRKFVSYQLSCNAAELSILLIGVLLAPFLGWPIPILLSLQILFMNLVTDDLPAVTLGLSGSSHDIMDEKPRKKVQIINHGALLMLIFSGFLIAIFTLGVFLFTFTVMGQDISSARTTTLVALIFLEIASAFVFRSFRKSVLTRSPFSNKYLAIASGISILATAIIVYSPLNKIFETSPIPGTDWLIALGFSLLLIAILDFLKFLNNKKKFLKF